MSQKSSIKSLLLHFFGRQRKPPVHEGRFTKGVFFVGLHSKSVAYAGLNVDDLRLDGLGNLVPTEVICTGIRQKIKNLGSKQNIVFQNKNKASWLKQSSISRVHMR